MKESDLKQLPMQELLKLAHSHPDDFIEGEFAMLEDKRE